MTTRTTYIQIAICFVVFNVVGIWFPWGIHLVNILTMPVILFLLYRLHSTTVKNMEKNATMLSEAGNAITDTLKIAFENLKKVSGNITKTQGKLSDHEGRLHRLEQGTQRAAGLSARREAIKNIESGREANKTSNLPRTARTVRTDNTEET